MKQLNLVVPGLLGPFSSELSDYIQQQLKQTELSLLSKCLSKSRIQSLPVATYFETLGYLVHPKNKKSLCQLTAEIDGLNVESGYLYRADPVHFKAESDHAVLIGTELVVPSIEEADELTEKFNQHFLEDGLSLLFSHSNRWYLKSLKPLKLSFTPMDYAMGRDIKHFMPEGDDALWWRKILNEAQMLFFQNKVNEQRESQGKLTINGLWLWDEKSRANEQVTELVKQVFADDVVSTTLAYQQNIAVYSADNIGEIHSTSLLVRESLYQSVCYGDVEAWLNELLLFCQNEFKGVVDLLMTRKVDFLNIYPCNGQVFKVSRLDLLKFWIKTKSINEFMD